MWKWHLYIQVSFELSLHGIFLRSIRYWNQWLIWWRHCFIWFPKAHGKAHKLRCIYVFAHFLRSKMENIIATVLWHKKSLMRTGNPRHDSYGTTAQRSYSRGSLPLQLNKRMIKWILTVRSWNPKFNTSCHSSKTNSKQSPRTSLSQTMVIWNSTNSNKFSNFMNQQWISRLKKNTTSYNICAENHYKTRMTKNLQDLWNKLERRENT